jgi:hypothetical protein
VFTLDEIKTYLSDSIASLLADDSALFTAVKNDVNELLKKEGGITISTTRPDEYDWLVRPIGWIVEYLMLPKLSTATISDKYYDVTTNNYESAINEIKANAKKTNSKINSFAIEGLVGSSM